MADGCKQIWRVNEKTEMKVAVVVGKVCGLTDAVVPQVPGQALPLVLRIVLPLPLLELLTGQILVLRFPLRPQRKTELMRELLLHREFAEQLPKSQGFSSFLSHVRRGRRRPLDVIYTHRLLTLSTETLVAGRAGDLQLVSVVNKPRGALRKNKNNFMSSVIIVILFNSGSFLLLHFSPSHV